MKKIIIFSMLLLAGAMQLSAQKEINGFHILKQIDSCKAKTLLTFKYKDSKQIINYNLQLEGNDKIVLIESKSKKTIETYQQMYKPDNPKPPYNNCNAQEKQQWNYFKANVLPGLVQNANRACRSVRYCLMIFCNGQPRVAYMLLIRPSRVCPELESAEKEVNRYGF